MSSICPADGDISDYVKHFETLDHFNTVPLNWFSGSENFGFSIISDFRPLLCLWTSVLCWLWTLLFCLIKLTCFYKIPSPFFTSRNSSCVHLKSLSSPGHHLCTHPTLENVYESIMQIFPRKLAFVCLGQERSENPLLQVRWRHLWFVCCIIQIKVITWIMSHGNLTSLKWHVE